MFFRDRDKDFRMIVDMQDYEQRNRMEYVVIMEVNVLFLLTAYS